MSSRALSFFVSFVVASLAWLAIPESASAQGSIAYFEGEVISGTGAGQGLVGTPAALTSATNAQGMGFFQAALANGFVWNGNFNPGYDPLHDEVWFNCWWSNGYYICLAFNGAAMLSISDGSGNSVEIKLHRQFH